MDAVLKDILQSPRLHDYVNELQQYLLEEDSKRKAFYQNMRDDEKVEFINGEVVYHSPAKYKHTQLVENIASVLTRFVRKNNLGQVLREKALVKLRRNDFEPDICFFRKEISDAFEPNTMFYPVPDFVVEVLSDSTERIDRGVKRIDYALNRVKEYWLVDADKKFIEQYILQTDQFELAEKIQHGTVRCKVLDGLIIPLKAIFDEDKNEEFLREI
jgi:Uma2 family endonuclease